MGAEQLEEDEFEPMFTACESSCPARRSLCLAPMDGEMVSGCAIGMRPAAMTAL